MTGCINVYLDYCDLRAPFVATCNQTLLLNFACNLFNASYVYKFLDANFLILI